MRAALAFALLLSACTQGPTTETSETALANQAKAIEKAANGAVNQSIADIAAEDAVAKVDPINATASQPEAKPILASAKPVRDPKK
jgi:hypothetical protein